MAHSKITIADISALSLHVIASGCGVLNITVNRQILVNDLALETIEETLQIIQSHQSLIKKHSHHSYLDEVLEEREDEIQRDSQTKECLVHIHNNFSKNEVILEPAQNENSDPNLPLKDISNTLQKLEIKEDLKIIEEPTLKPIIHEPKNNPSQQEPQETLNMIQNSLQQMKIQSQKQINISQIEVQINSPPKKKKSILSQQLSQIKVDKVKEAEEEKELMNFVSTIDPLSMIPKLQQMNFFDESRQQSKTQDVLIFPDKSLMFVNPQKQANLMESQPESPWYGTSSVEYKATSYNTNESSNLDHHSYKWKSESRQEENFLKEYGIQFESSVFDFPYPAKFDETYENNEKIQLTPKKPRLFCNSKKVPRWAENLAVVSKYQIKQKQEKSKEIFGSLQLKLQRLSKHFSEKKNNYRGSSAQWNNAQNILNNKLNKLVQLQDENRKKLKQFQKESVKKNRGFFARTQQFFTSLKKKIWNSWEKNNQYQYQQNE